MNVQMMQLFQNANHEKRIEYIDRMDPDHFSLITFIDSLTPALVWESNLRFGSFHLIKMSLYIRDFARRKFFSAETDRALAKAILQHLYYLPWPQI